MCINTYCKRFDSRKRVIFFKLAQASTAAKHKSYNEIGSVQRQRHRIANKTKHTYVLYICIHV